MTTQEILEGNKLIADFMGAKRQIEGRDIKKHEIWLPTHGICRFDTIELGMGKTLHYHKSWDWLIPVIQKIYNINRSFYESMEDSLPLLDLSHSYNEVVEFIKHYNSNK